MEFQSSNVATPAGLILEATPIASFLYSSDGYSVKRQQSHSPMITRSAKSPNF